MSSPEIRHLQRRAQVWPTDFDKWATGAGPKKDSFLPPQIRPYIKVWSVTFPDRMGSAADYDEEIRRIGCAEMDVCGQRTGSRQQNVPIFRPVSSIIN